MNNRILKSISMFISFALVVSTLALGQTQSSKSTDDTSPAPAPVPKLDINSANREQLMKLGLTEALSLKIISSRPYASKSDLIERKIVPDTVYARITDLIVAIPAKSR
jgi:competence protein ComEA